MTAWWISFAVLVHLFLRPAIRSKLGSDPSSIFCIYKVLFSGLNDASHNAALSGLFSLLGGTATLALTLRGMAWQKRGLPTNARMHYAWLQKVMDTSVRENAAVLLMAMLCGVYGFMVVCYGFLVGTKKWQGLGLPFFIILLALYIVVATLPAFISKSDAGEISGYASTLIGIANLAEWRYRNQCNNAIVGDGVKSGEFRGTLGAVRTFLCDGRSDLMGVFGRFVGLVGLALVSASAAERTAGAWWGILPVFVLLFVMVAFFEYAVLWALQDKMWAISSGRISFDIVFSRMFGFFVTLSIWSVYVVLTVRALWEILLVGVLFVWWLVRMWCALMLKPRPERILRFRARLEELAGLRPVLEFWIDQALLENKARLASYSSKGVQVTEELSVAAGLVVPENFVMRRGSESMRLRDYLSTVVGLSLPSMATSSPDPQSVTSSGSSSNLEGARPEVISGADGLPTPSRHAGRRGRPRRGERRRRRARRGWGGWRRR